MIRPSPFLVKPERWLLESNFSFIFDNEFPVLKGHALVVPKREIENFFDLNDDEWRDIKDLSQKYLKSLSALGFNLVVNGGEIAGQSVAHFHIHIFPHFEPHHMMLKGGYSNAFGHLPNYYR
jgi:histidine triad (HIT) family protein